MKLFGGGEGEERDKKEGEGWKREGREARKVLSPPDSEGRCCFEVISKVASREAEIE